MKRRDFLTLSALAPLAAYFGLKAKPALASEGEVAGLSGDEMPVLPPLDWSKIHFAFDRYGLFIYATEISDFDNFVYADNGTAVLRQRKGKSAHISIPRTIVTTEVTLTEFTLADRLEVMPTHLLPHLQAECQANLTARATKLIDRARAAGTDVNQVRVCVGKFRFTPVADTAGSKWQVVYELGMWAYHTGDPVGLTGNPWAEYIAATPLYSESAMARTLYRNLFAPIWNV